MKWPLLTFVPQFIFQENRWSILFLISKKLPMKSCSIIGPKDSNIGGSITLISILGIYSSLSESSTFYSLTSFHLTYWDGWGNNGAENSLVRNWRSFVKDLCFAIRRDYSLSFSSFRSDFVGLILRMIYLCYPIMISVILPYCHE